MILTKKHQESNVDLTLKFAWNSLRSENDSEYSIGAAREARLKGSLKGHNDLALICVPPTRLAGLCRRVLTQMFEN